MRLLFIRHADPDYSIDSLTAKGFEEAELLAEKLKNEKIDYAYVSPLGRAQKTAEIGLKYKTLQPQTKDCLTEFGVPFTTEEGENLWIWDWLPTYYNANPALFDTEKWLTVPCIANSAVPAAYKRVTEEFDRILAAHGYVRNGLIYNVERSNTDTLAFFCHFGIETVLLSHLIGVAPPALLHGFCALPSSVTTVYTEERRQGYAHFRCSAYGSTEHLYIAGKEPSFAARFCEIFDSPDRH
ncbi:MAG: histidine phosphatase family protein [Clostridia bacterium]|nr:histidine phosphatase family protein [Clostridia bacterium]